jgi:hypothetical protein
MKPDDADISDGLAGVLELWRVFRRNASVPAVFSTPVFQH